jgi:C-terminal processing protease CtpA/Prc
MRTVRSTNGGASVALVLGGVLFLAALAALALGWSRLREVQAENAALRSRAEEADRLRQENERLRPIEVAQDELERLRKQTQEIHKLRAQYQELQRLREDYAALQKQFEQVSAQNQPLAAAQNPAGRSPAQPSVVAPTTLTSWIGVALQPLAAGQESIPLPPGVSQGAVVQEVVAGGPAQNSGLRAGDVITAVDGKPVATQQQVQAEIRTRPIGQAVILDIVRDGVVQKISIVTGALAR